MSAGEYLYSNRQKLRIKYLMCSSDEPHPHDMYVQSCFLIIIILNIVDVARNIRYWWTFHIWYDCINKKKGRDKPIQAGINDTISTMWTETKMQLKKHITFAPWWFLLVNRCHHAPSPDSNAKSTTKTIVFDSYRTLFGEHTQCEYVFVHESVSEYLYLHTICCCLICRIGLVWPA